MDNIQTRMKVYRGLELEHMSVEEMREAVREIADRSGCKDNCVRAELMQVRLSSLSCEGKARLYASMLK